MPDPNSLSVERLRGVEEFRVFESKLDDLIKAHAAALEEASSWEEHMFRKGCIKTLRAIRVLPDELFVEKEEKEKAERKLHRGAPLE